MNIVDHLPLHLFPRSPLNADQSLPPLITETGVRPRTSNLRPPSPVSSLLDTWDQVGIEPGPAPDPFVDDHLPAQLIYRPVPNLSPLQIALARALDACARFGEAIKVRACRQVYRVYKCLDCAANPATPLSCYHRLCSACASRRANVMLARHEAKLKQLRYPKMLTLTFLSVPHISREYLSWARACFTKLRHRDIFKGCWGGLYAFEFTHSDEYGWHLHIHVLLASSYIPHAQLSTEWAAITGASIVWIESINTWADRRADVLGLTGLERKYYLAEAKWHSVREIIKYATKISTFIDQPELVNEFLIATTGSSLMYGFGALYRIRASRPGKAELVCPLCGSTNIDTEFRMTFVIPAYQILAVNNGFVWGGLLAEYAESQGRASPDTIYSKTLSLPAHQMSFSEN